MEISIEHYEELGFKMRQGRGSGMWSILEHVLVSPCLVMITEMADQ